MTTRAAVRVFRWTGKAALVVGLWFAVLLTVTATGLAGGRVLVLAPDAVRAIVGADGALIEGRSSAMVAEGGPDRWFAARLYAAGAWLVLPANQTPCGGTPGAGRAR